MFQAANLSSVACRRAIRAKATELLASTIVAPKTGLVRGPRRSVPIPADIEQEPRYIAPGFLYEARSLALRS